MPENHDDLSPEELRLKLRELELEHEREMAEIGLKKAEGWRAFLKPLVAAVCGLIGLVGAYWLGGVRTSLDMPEAPSAEVAAAPVLKPPMVGRPAPRMVVERDTGSDLGLDIEPSPVDTATPVETLEEGGGDMMIEVDTGEDAPPVAEQLLRLLPMPVSVGE